MPKRSSHHHTLPTRNLQPPSASHQESTTPRTESFVSIPAQPAELAPRIQWEEDREEALTEETWAELRHVWTLPGGTVRTDNDDNSLLLSEAAQKNIYNYFLPTREDIYPVGYKTKFAFEMDPAMGSKGDCLTILSTNGRDVYLFKTGVQGVYLSNLELGMETRGAGQLEAELHSKGAKIFSVGPGDGYARRNALVDSESS